MHQPSLDLTNYDKPASPADYGGDMQTFLSRAPKTDGRLGFNPASTFSGGQYIQSFLTPYGLQVMEGHYIKVLSTFGVFNYKILKRLCESPLPDASVINLVDNAVRIMLEDEPGEMHEFVMTHVGLLNIHGKHGKKLDWSACGCNCLIEWLGNCRLVSLEVASLLETTGRLRVIPIEERMCPRSECVPDLRHYPHPNAVTWRGKPVTDEYIEKVDKEIREYRDAERRNRQ